MRRAALVALLVSGALAQDEAPPLASTTKRWFKSSEGKEVALYSRGTIETGGKKCDVIVHEGMEGDLALLLVEPTKDGHIVRRFERQITPTFHWMKWPLKKDLKWEATVEAGKAAKHKITLTFEVKGEEEVKTVAGAFMAWKVAFTYASESLALEGAYWYSPKVGEVKRWVKSKGKEVTFELSRLRDWGEPAANHKAAAQFLKQLVSVQMTYRLTDADGNEINEYWTGDVSGLYRLKTSGLAIKLIDVSIARADGAPLPKGDALGDVLCAEPEPRDGYLFRALAKFDAGNGEEAYGERNRDRFGFVAYPAEYPQSGKLTFLVTEAGTVFSKDTGGKPVDTFPRDPATAGWKH